VCQAVEMVSLSDQLLFANNIHSLRYKQGATLRVPVILPSYPVRDDKVDAHGNDEHHEILVVSILGHQIQNINPSERDESAEENSIACKYKVNS